jgi:hypothetical protein
VDVPPRGALVELRAEDRALTRDPLGKERVAVARYRKGGPATICLRGTLLGAPFEQRFQVELPEVDRDNPELERMWAWHRVQRLLEEERREGSPGTRVPEIVTLGEGYSIASEHASFLVLENDAEYQRWKIERNNVARLTRDRDAQRRLAEKLEELRQRTTKELGPPREDSKPAAEPQRGPAPRPTPSVSVDPPPATRGGGALDPLSGLLALGLVAACFGRRRRERAER